MIIFYDPVTEIMTLSHGSTLTFTKTNLKEFPEIPIARLIDHVRNPCKNRMQAHADLTLLARQTNENVDNPLP